MMGEAKAKVNMNELLNCNKNAIIIAVTIIALVVVFLYFWDRQQKRALELERLETQTEVWQEWGPPQQNRQLNNTTGEAGGKIL